MLSILIPTYNYDCADLVEALYKQCVATNTQFEIIVGNDCSTFKLSKLESIKRHTECSIITPKHNLGRAKMRNYLAHHAHYQNLLFIDSDSLPAYSNFIATYLNQLNNIVLGGRIYNTPSNRHHTLLPRYGKRERNHGTKKSTLPFTSPNFLIPRNIFQQIRFDETCKKYGHEDTIFGIELNRHGFYYSRIDNPVIHIGIEDNITFLKKTQEGINHLYSIHCKGNYPELNSISPLLKTFLLIKKLKLTSYFAKYYSKRYKKLEQQLDTKKPCMLLFSLYKLCYLSYHALHTINPDKMTQTIAR